MLRTSSVLLHNKLYTAEQEVELQALVDDVCSGAKSDRDKAEALVTYIRKSMETGPCTEFNGWDTLCDGDTETTVVGDGFTKYPALKRILSYEYFTGLRKTSIFFECHFSKQRDNVFVFSKKYAVTFHSV